MRLDKLIVLDLDETLIHARTKLPHVDFRVGPYEVVMRPQLQPFLQFVHRHFQQVGIWTSASAAYAEAILAQILPTGLTPDHFDFLWSARRCTNHIDPETREYVSLKPIRKLTRKGYPRTKILFVDDTPAKIKRSYGNYIRVPEFLGDPEDRILAKLAAYLMELGPLPNVRPIEKRFWLQRDDLCPWDLNAPN